MGAADYAGINPPETHKRFLVQAAWTNALRRYVQEQLSLERPKILEIGSGTGAVLTDLLYENTTRFGVDIALERLGHHRSLDPNANLTAADGSRLPFLDSAFDLVFCHYLLLWVREPQAILKEMFRVLRPGGILAVFAEPDYLARIDMPSRMRHLGKMQNDSLVLQGARIDAGRTLSEFFTALGTNQIELGTYAAHWALPANAEQNSEAWVLKQDLLALGLSDNAAMRQVNAWLDAKALVHIPTFYAWARK